MSRKTVVHIGDFHLGPGPRQADRLRAFDGVISDGMALPALALWGIPGDLFHARSTVDDRNALKERVKRMASVAPVVITYGNHDVPGDLDIFSDLYTAWPVMVAKESRVLQFATPHGDMAVFCLPYPREFVLALQGPTAREALAKEIQAGAAQLELAEEVGAVGLVLGHADYVGVTRASGQPIVGTEVSLDAELLAPLGDRYIGLNHIHHTQDIGPVTYAGSICRLDWGEIEDKCYVRVDYDGYGLRLVRRVWISVPPMYHVDLDVLPVGWIIPQEFANTQWKGCEVRVRVRYPQSLRSVLETMLPNIKARFAAALRLQVELVCIPDRAVRAPAVAAAKTLQEKLRAWAEVTGVVPPDGVEQRLAMLETKEPQAVVDIVEHQLAFAPEPETQAV